MDGFIKLDTIKKEKDLIIEVWGEDFYNFCLTTDAPTFLDAQKQFGIWS